jgi:hypothetical protein
MHNYIDKELINRLTRIETKLVRGFEELGVNIDKDAEWLSVDEPNRVVYISTLGRSITVMLSDMQRGGATKEGDWYDIVHRGVVVGTIMFKKIS